MSRLMREYELIEHSQLRNKRVSQRYDELMLEAKHGHYETLFRVVREECERAYEKGYAMGRVMYNGADND